MGDSLTIVIPALNEEGAIGQTISRCLEARQDIMESAGVATVEVVVVSDGSTDRTIEIARGFKEVKVIVFEENRGYGAAIKEGWSQGTGTLVGFLDADGTCDPQFFGEMCRLCVEESADVTLGSRLGPESQMPRVRRIGNRVYALMLGFLCGRHVTDTASGMRVVRRNSLKDLYPLPDGLHFTPSMSARAMLNNLRVMEIPIPYAERIGQSKLSVLRDGIRFFKTIMSGVLCYRPEKLFLMAFSLCMLFLVLLAVRPTEYYFENQRLEEWMIYRFSSCSLLGSVGLLLLLATALTNRMAQFSRRRVDANTFWASLVGACVHGPVFLGLAAVLLLASVGFLWPGIIEFFSTGEVYMHWSRLLAGSFALFSLFQTGIFFVLIMVTDVWKDQYAAHEPVAIDARTTSPVEAEERVVESSACFPITTANSDVESGQT
jgi:glycosyltransferase involved in cell wall biosynthesis